MANIIKCIAQYIRHHPDSEEAIILRDLCMALEQEACFNLARLYDLRSEAFILAKRLVEEWGFIRHVESRRLDNYLKPDPVKRPGRSPG